MPTLSPSRALQAASFFLCLGGATQIATAAEDQTEAEKNFEDVTPEECALIEDGVQRLTCYDAINDPSKAREQASEEKIEAIDEATDVLEYEELANAEDEDASVEKVEEDGDSDSSGVMSSMLNRYVAAEKAIFSFSGSFVGHRPMYILPATYMKNANRDPSSPRLDAANYDYGIDNQEAKYQISFKVPLLTGWLDDRTTLWFGYTQKSFWQVYNTDDSAPFRETNYEPEFFLRYATDYDIGPGTLSGVSLGLNHESNGQSEPRSRSWNRIVASAAYSYDRWLFMIQPWYRLPEASSEDDNEDIERYVGHADYMAIYKWSEDRTLSLTVQNNLRSEDNKTSVELGYSFPMGDTIKGYGQYFNGYGESLIDYNERIQRIGIGIMLNDWL
ncbi:phospholipase A [Marinobacter sp. HL-58]|uniref:phospholipase A n=1 Tax=Marinobacter sp. HL-58 TaxID=1479237 RepID=UPI00068F9C78|nr:phospholipase A [Marinobacter sp. HL-58]KPP99331.1 MAG: bifunctional autotransporter / phospholipase A1 PldA [Marinobacter sp. HL-58]